VPGVPVFRRARRRRAEALAAGEEAPALRRGLVAQNRDAFLPDLATSLGATSQVLMALDRPTDAFALLADAVTWLHAPWPPGTLDPWHLSVPICAPSTVTELVRTGFRGRASIDSSYPGAWRRRSPGASMASPHPLGSKARILLSSVFGPYAQDDEYGSRAINPMELYHNQVTRGQGPFSLRMHHRSWGLMLIQENISAPTTLLDFPTRDRFIEEISTGQYDIIGIGSIIVNVGKVREMCRLVRQHSPSSTIVVGGHVAAIPGIEQMVDADEIVRGEGIRWFREFLGEPIHRAVKHPVIPSSFGFRLFGLQAPRGGGNPAATIIPSVGCPMGCNFCTTSSFYGGKGKFINFFDTGEQLFKVMCEAESAIGVSCFFMMDENFLLHKKRALALLELMKQHDKAWSLYVFSSANALAKYSMRQLVELGVNWVWIGLESAESNYAKLNGTDTMALTNELRAHGIRVQGSTIVGLEHHTPENIAGEIDYAVSHECDSHQFMLYTPVPGTPLYHQIKDEGRLLDVDLADIHGQYKFNFTHAHIPRELSKPLLDGAFARDYERNGPSLFRLTETMFRGWLRYRHDPDARVRRRFELEAKQLRTVYGGLLWAIERYLRDERHGSAGRVGNLRREMERELGGIIRIASRVFGPALYWAIRRDARRYPAGRQMEPQTFVDRRPARSIVEETAPAPQVATFVEESVA
jgi:radical SAM superfamily enzyme YgiQ (UPF0313 family)